MDPSLKSKLVAVYQRYGFHYESREGVLVFTLKTGYFDNAEIVKISPQTNTEAVFSEFTAAGYACTVREAVSPERTERDLFVGFFSVESTRHRLLDEYKRFAANLVAPYGPNAQYVYIKAPYQINGKEGQCSPPEEVVNRMREPGPVLFLIEAAAGFGKTCAALEIVRLLAEQQEHLPLYAELSRNRQARIFRYILLDEIDRTFPLLSSGLVQTEIRNGRVATILDGFDELLRKSEEAGAAFENKEPMLETVSELLTGNAKVIITTRRTVLFDGDEFHQWLDRHAESFKVIRMRIQEPRIENWLPSNRLESLSSSGLQMDAMANPVLLSYLRCIDDDVFGRAVSRPESIVESYFSYMLERERGRQDLRMTAVMQGGVLRALAKDMMDVGYTAESRDQIISFLLNTLPKLIDDTRTQYATTERPSREEIANKLANHALLDRSAIDPNKISFINEFALGHYVAENILVDREWMSDDLRFIDPAVRSYVPRSKASKDDLYAGLSGCLPYLDISSQIEIAASLIGAIPIDLNEDEAEGISLDVIEIGNRPISNFLFNECIFRHCLFDISRLSEVTFLNCKFYHCSVSEGEPGGAIYVLGGTSNPDITQLLSVATRQAQAAEAVDPARQADLVVLRKLWPIGETLRQRPSRPIYKPLKFLCAATGGVSSGALYDSVDRLLRAGIIVEKAKSGLITLDFDRLPSVLELAGDEL